MGCNPGRTEDFEFSIKSMLRQGKGSSIAGLPPHLQVVNRDGEPSPSLRRQFCAGKASRKKRGKK